MRNPHAGLFGEALEMLRDAERMHRQFFTLARSHGGPCWEPPVDIVEDARGVIVRVALPGVAPGDVEVVSDGARLSVVGGRRLPASAHSTIHRLEIPYGRFERAIELPPGRYEVIAREHTDGCLVLALRRHA